MNGNMMNMNMNMANQSMNMMAGDGAKNGLFNARMQFKRVNPQVPNGQMVQGQMVQPQQLPNPNRPQFQQAATQQQIITNASSPANHGKFMMLAPNLASAPFPPLSSSAENLTGHTPHMANQPQPQMNRGLVLMTPAPVAGGKTTPILAQQQAPQGARLQQAPAPGAIRKNPQEIQQELNAEIFKRNLGNAGVVRVLDLVDQVSSESIENLLNIEYWQRVVQMNFLPTSTFRLSLPPTPDSNGPDSGILGGFASKSGQFELNATTAPRFFITSVVAGNLARFHVALPGIKFQVMNNAFIFIISKVCLEYVYKDGSSFNVYGTVKLLMNREFRIEWVDCQLVSSQSHVSLPALERIFKDEKPDWNLVLESCESSRLRANAGLHDSAMRSIQVGDAMLHLRSLMAFLVVNNISSPMKAMELFMTLCNNQRNSILQQGLNGAASSPSPLTDPDDPKPKKRRMSSSNLLKTKAKR